MVQHAMHLPAASTVMVSAVRSFSEKDILTIRKREKRTRIRVLMPPGLLESFLRPGSSVISSGPSSSLFRSLSFSLSLSQPSTPSQPQPSPPNLSPRKRGPQVKSLRCKGSQSTKPLPQFPLPGRGSRISQVEGGLPSVSTLSSNSPTFHYQQPTCAPVLGPQTTQVLQL